MNSQIYIQQVAYQLWEAEGRPEGKADKHWDEAIILVNAASNSKLEASKKQPMTSEAEKAIAREQPDQT